MVDVARSLRRAAVALSVALYRSSGGRVMGTVRSVPVLLLTVAGRTSGVEHTVPVSYFENDGAFVVTGSGGGSALEPQWFRNLRHADHARIEVGSRHYDVDVAVAGADDRDALWATLLTHAPFFADYQVKVERQIPMAVLTPTAARRAGIST